MENQMNITSAQYYLDMNGNNAGITLYADGEKLLVPLAPGNRHYDEIMRQQSEGLLTIADAE